jgi:hypothetical protein
VLSCYVLFLYAEFGRTCLEDEQLRNKRGTLSAVTTPEQELPFHVRPCVIFCNHYAKTGIAFYVRPCVTFFQSYARAGIAFPRASLFYVFQVLHMPTWLSWC